MEASGPTKPVVYASFIDILTALCIVVVLIAVAVTDASHKAAVLEHIDGDVVIVHACRFGIDAFESGAAVIENIVQWNFRTSTGARAAISTIIR